MGGHVVFIVLHIVAIVFGFVFLIITIPAHLIYAAVSGKSEKAPSDAETPTAETHVRCPACRELVRSDASKCKHCGTALVPQVIERPSTKEKDRLIAWTVGLFAVVFLVYACTRR